MLSLFEFKVEATREIEEEISILLDAEDEEDALNKVSELVNGFPYSEVTARRYHVGHRHYLPPTVVGISLVRGSDEEPILA